MHPVLFSFSLGSRSIVVPSYSFFLFLGYCTCYAFCLRTAPSNHLRKILAFGIPGLFLGGLVGAYLFYVVLGVLFQIDFPSQISLTGATLTGLILLWLLSIFLHIPLSELISAILPGFFLGCAIGRIGCFLGGCCFGKQSHLFLPWLSSHPTQLYESLLYLVSFLIFRKIKCSPSAIYCGLLCFFSIRFAVEFLRGDNRRGILEGLSFTQWFSLMATALILVGQGLKKILADTGVQIRKTNHA